MGKLVLVEDDPNIRGYMEELIKRVDSSQEIFSTGYAAEAFQYAQSETVDAFILDIQLLDYSGVVLAEQIRQMDVYKLTPIVFITGDVGQELNAFRNTQCYRFIAKPFGEDKVLETIRTVLNCGSRKPEQERYILLKQRGFSLAVAQDDILYVESMNRRILVVTRHETIELSSYTLGSMADDLGVRFFQCHKSFIVNSDWIQRVNRLDMRIHLAEDRGSIPYGDKYRDRLGAWL